MGLFDNLFENESQENAQEYGLYSFMEEESKNYDQPEDEFACNEFNESQKEEDEEENAWKFEEDMEDEEGI